MKKNIIHVRSREPQKISIAEDIIVSYFHSIGEKDLLLLLIHGLGSSKEDFLSIFDYPELIINSILFADLIGHGDSSDPLDFSYSMEDQAKILLKLLNAISFKGKIVLVAHSMGGPIAVSLAELLGDSVSGMIYAEGNIDEGDCFLSKKIIDSFFIEDWINIGFNKYIKKLESNGEMKTFAKTFSKANPVAIYQSSQDLVAISKKDTLVGRLVQLSVPILGLYGDRNKGKFSSEKKLASSFPIQFVPNSGHSMMHDNSDSFFHNIISFLTQLQIC